MEEKNHFILDLFVCELWKNGKINPNLNSQENETLCIQLKNHDVF